MHCRLRLLTNRLRKSVTKAPNFHASLRQDSIIARGLSCGIVTAKEIRESNLAYADLFADYKSTNKFSTQIKPELLHSNLKSLSSRRCNKLRKEPDEKRCNICQLTQKFPFLQNPSEKYRLSYLQERVENACDEVESELFDFQHFLDPSYKIKISQDLVDEKKRRTYKDKFDSIKHSIKLYEI